MKSGVRYWLMIAVLVGATTAMAYLSHGESTPPAKPLTEFPAQVAGYTKAADWPLDRPTLDLLGVTDYLNRGYISKSQGLI
ncbi:MAG: exosortase-associated EpsI family protein, partial [Formivibrio sp.]|nr:exosortase-associated EpsI family protein [Formivibrio sp.]